MAGEAEREAGGIRAPSDEELIERVRAGDLSAYEHLWSANVRAAQRLAYRYDPAHAEDLVSEAFLAVYEQIAVVGKGPRSAFRAYLFTVIRNSAIKRGREGDLVFSDPELDTVDTADGMTLVTETEDAAYLLSAFTALPPRWQRVLWMSEIENAPRGVIAQSLGIRPNAVSALLRRARTGLRREWLAGQVPAELRDDPAHAARFLVGYVTGATIDAPRRAVRAHLDACDTCRDLHRDLLGDYRRMRNVTLAAAGFAALAITLPANSPVPAAAAGASAVTLFGATASGGAVGIGAIVVGGGLVTALIGGITMPAAVDPATADDHVVQAPAPEASESTPPSPAPTSAPTAAPSPEPDAAPIETEQPAPLIPGRGNTSSEIPTLDADYSFETLVTPRPQPPARDPVTPAPGGEAPGDAGTDGTEASVALTSEPPATTYLTPALTGTSSDAAAVFVALGDDVYDADLVAATGEWHFDAAGVSLAAASYDYRIWAEDASGARSAPVTGSFVIAEPEVVGFEDTADLQISEASTTGIVFTARGAPGGVLCVDSDSGQRAELSLDETGTVSRRIRFLAGGFYTVSFRMCADDRWGPVADRSLFVDDPSVIFSPFDLRDPAIEFSDPAETSG